MRTMELFTARDVVREVTWLVLVGVTWYVSCVTGRGMLLVFAGIM